MGTQFENHYLASQGPVLRGPLPLTPASRALPSPYLPPQSPGPLDSPAGLGSRTHRVHLWTLFASRSMPAMPTPFVQEAIFSSPLRAPPFLIYIVFSIIPFLSILAWVNTVGFSRLSLNYRGRHTSPRLLGEHTASLTGEATDGCC